jgi:GT2 family glycosyltransferase
MIVNEMPGLTVVVVNYFSEESLTRCLRSLAGQSEPVEVIVADNGSRPDRREALVRSHPALIWRAMGTNAGFAAASNVGARLARSDKLLFLNPDAVVVGDGLGALVRALDSAEYAGAILGCAIRDEDGSIQLSCRRFPTWRTFLASRHSLLTRLVPSNAWSTGYLMRDFDHRRIMRVDWVSGAAMAMRREIFERLCGFDESFFLYFEDVDLCRRAKALGIPVIYYPEVVVEHAIGGSSRRVPYRALAWRHRSMWTYYRRYHRRPWLDPLAWAAIFGRLGGLCAAEAIGRLRFAWPAVAAEPGRLRQGDLS